MHFRYDHEIEEDAPCREIKIRSNSCIFFIMFFAMIKICRVDMLFDLSS